MSQLTPYSIAKEEIKFYSSEYTTLENYLALIIGPKSNYDLLKNLSEKGIRYLAELSIEELKQEIGVGEVIANRLYASFNLAKFINKYDRKNLYKIESAEDAIDYFKDLKLINHEQFEAIFLNSKNQVLKRSTIFKGSLNVSIVHPREVFKEALKYSSASIIVAHNHPSGDPSPSQEDIQVTKRLLECGTIMGIEVLDHIIIGNNSVSLKEKRYI